MVVNSYDVKKKMAFLTGYSYSQLIQRVEIKDVDKIDKQFFKTNIYDNDYLYYFFNNLELKKMFAEKVLLSGDKRFVPVYKKVPDRQDNLNYVMSIKGKVKYHKNNSCKALNRGFRNFFIPEPIVRLEQASPQRHEKLVEEIRNWFKIKNYTLERYELGEITDKILTRDFNSTFPDKFDIDKISISQSDKGQFKWFIEKKTNSIEQTEVSFDHNVFLEKISELIKRRGYICNSNTLKNLSKYDHLVRRDNEAIVKYINESIEKGYLREVSPEFIANFGIENLKKLWSSHLSLKKEAMQLLSNFFKWTYNYDSSTFEEIFLEDYNLKACSLCYK